MSVPHIMQHEGSKYVRSITDVRNPDHFAYVDVYSVLVAFNVTCPARQHAIKKLLCAGLRNKGDEVADVKGAFAAVCRAVQLAEDKSRTVEPMDEATRKHVEEWINTRTEKGKDDAQSQRPGGEDAGQAGRDVGGVESGVLPSDGIGASPPGGGQPGPDPAQDGGRQAGGPSGLPDDTPRSGQQIAGGWHSSNPIFPKTFGNIPSTFDGGTGLSSTTAGKKTERIPNSADAPK